MKKNGFLLVIFLWVFSFGNNRFVLESELRTDYNGSGVNNFLTAYTYDAQGNRLMKRVWAGIDSLSGPISKCSYSYTINGLVAEELLLGQLGDTLSIVQYTYTDSLPVSVKILRKDGSLRYADSLLYDMNKQLVEMRRYNSSMTMTFYHRYTYDAPGRKTADSLYESSGPSTYVPTQTVAVAYNNDGTVSSEASWRISGSQQYLISTVKFGYASLLLVSAATYEGDGTGNRLIDSLAYAYDSFGNRIQEELFDNERVKNHKIVFTWRDTLVTALAKTEAPKSIGQMVLYRDRSIVFNRPFTGSAAVYGMNGKAIAAATLKNTDRYYLPAALCEGHYILSLACGKTVTNHQITIIR